MADVDLEPLLEATADGDWIAAEAARLTQTTGFSLLSLVERLGPVLTSTNTASRVAGVGLLLLHRLRPLTWPSCSWW